MGVGDCNKVSRQAKCCVGLRRENALFLPEAFRRRLLLREDPEPLFPAGSIYSFQFALGLFNDCAYQS